METVTSLIASVLGLMYVKKPSLDLSRLSCTLIPSRVMLRAPLGRPLTDEVRGRPGVAVPGIARTRSRASREAVGKSLICRPVKVVPTVADCVCSNSPPPTTVTVSFADPISSSTLIVEALPTSILMSVTAACLKPERSYRGRVHSRRERRNTVSSVIVGLRGKLLIGGSVFHGHGSTGYHRTFRVSHSA